MYIEEQTQDPEYRAVLLDDLDFLILNEMRVDDHSSDDLIYKNYIQGKPKLNQYGYENRVDANSEAGYQRAVHEREKEALRNLIHILSKQVEQRAKFDLEPS